MAHLDLDTAIVQNENNIIDKDNFKLVIYVSFKTQAESIALDLLYGLEDFCSER